MNKAIILIFILINISCGKVKKEELSMNDPGIPIPVLIDSIENHGNVAYYNSLEIASLDYRAGEFLSTFMIMADKYNNADASMTVYYNLIWMHNTPLIENSENGIYALDSLDIKTKELAIQYLKKADSLENKEASEHLKEYKLYGLIK